jgi:hypothetical protein
MIVVMPLGISRMEALALNPLISCLTRVNGF